MRRRFEDRVGGSRGLFVATGFALACLCLVPVASGQDEGKVRIEGELPPEGEAPKSALAPPDAETTDEGGPKAFIYTTDQGIRFFQDRVERDPKDFASLRLLGEFYERKAAETGSLECYELAEQALRKSLAIAPGYERAKLSLAAVLCSRHQFQESLELIRPIVEKDPDNLDARSIQGDAFLEVGRYDEAEAIYRKLAEIAKIPPVLSRLANLEDLKGHTEEAINLMQKALDAIRAARATRKEEAWYLSRLGEIALNAGRVDDAERFYREVPEGTDSFHDATAGLGRIRAAQGDYLEAIELYEKAVAIGPDPHMLAALGDLYIKIDQPERAEPLFERLEQITKDRREYRRERAVFLLNHDRRLDEALELARLDLSERADVFGHDTLAWALYKNDRLEDAERESQKARALGTTDARLAFHAGLIAMRLGRTDEAATQLRQALASPAGLGVRERDEAERALRGLSKAVMPPSDR